MTRIDLRTTGCQEIVIAGENDVSTAYEAAAGLARSLGFSVTDLTCIATAVTELARNILRYATNGTIVVSPVSSAGRVGIRIIASDNGPGINDLDEILSGNYRSASGLGLGLLGTKNLLDLFRVDTAPGEGTTVMGVKYVR